MRMGKRFLALALVFALLMSSVYLPYANTNLDYTGSNGHVEADISNGGTIETKFLQANESDTENGEEPMPDTENGEDPTPDTENGEDPTPDTENGEDPTPDTENGEDPTPDTENGEDPTPDTENGEDPMPDTENGEDPTPDNESGEDPTPGIESEESDANETVTEDNLEEKQIPSAWRVLKSIDIDSIDMPEGLENYVNGITEDLDKEDTYFDVSFILKIEPEDAGNISDIYKVTLTDSLDENAVMDTESVTSDYPVEVTKDGDTYVMKVNNGEKITDSFTVRYTARMRTNPEDYLTSASVTYDYWTEEGSGDNEEIGPSIAMRSGFSDTLLSDALSDRNFKVTSVKWAATDEKEYYTETGKNAKASLVINYSTIILDYNLFYGVGEIVIKVPKIFGITPTIPGGSHFSIDSEASAQGDYIVIKNSRVLRSGSTGYFYVSYGLDQDLTPNEELMEYALNGYYVKEDIVACSYENGKLLTEEGHLKLNVRLLRSDISISKSPKKVNGSEYPVTGSVEKGKGPDNYYWVRYEIEAKIKEAFDQFTKEAISDYLPKDAELVYVKAEKTELYDTNTGGIKKAEFEYDSGANKFTYTGTSNKLEVYVKFLKSGVSNNKRRVNKVELIGKYMTDNNKTKSSYSQTISDITVYTLQTIDPGIYSTSKILSFATSDAASEIAVKGAEMLSSTTLNFRDFTSSAENGVEFIEKSSDISYKSEQGNFLNFPNDVDTIYYKKFKVVLPYFIKSVTADLYGIRSSGDEVQLKKGFELKSSEEYSLDEDEKYSGYRLYMNVTSSSSAPSIALHSTFVFKGDEKYIKSNDSLEAIKDLTKYKLYTSTKTMEGNRYTTALTNLKDLDIMFFLSGNSYFTVKHEKGDDYNKVKFGILNPREASAGIYISKINGVKTMNKFDIVFILPEGIHYKDSSKRIVGLDLKNYFNCKVTTSEVIDNNDKRREKVVINVSPRADYPDMELRNLQYYEFPFDMVIDLDAYYKLYAKEGAEVKIEAMLILDELEGSVKNISAWLFPNLSPTYLDALKFINESKKDTYNVTKTYLIKDDGYLGPNDNDGTPRNIHQKMWEDTNGNGHREPYAVYSYVKTIIPPLTDDGAAASDLRVQIKTDLHDMQYDESITSKSSEYKYRAALNTLSTNSARDLILYSELPQVNDKFGSLWQPKFVSIDTKSMETRLDAKEPFNVYYSSSAVSGLAPKYGLYDDKGKLNDTVWQLLTPYIDSSKVKSLAVDASKLTIPPNWEVSIDVMVKAPDISGDSSMWDKGFTSPENILESCEAEFSYSWSILDANQQFVEKKQGTARAKVVLAAPRLTIGDSIWLDSDSNGILGEYHNQLANRIVKESRFRNLNGYVGYILDVYRVDRDGDDTIDGVNVKHLGSYSTKQGLDDIDYERDEKGEVIEDERGRKIVKNDDGLGLKYSLTLDRPQSKEDFSLEAQYYIKASLDISPYYGIDPSEYVIGGEILDIKEGLSVNRADLNGLIGPININYADSDYGDYVYKNADMSVKKKMTTRSKEPFKCLDDEVEYWIYSYESNPEQYPEYKTLYDFLDAKVEGRGFKYPYRLSDRVVYQLITPGLLTDFNRVTDSYYPNYKTLTSAIKDYVVVDTPNPGLMLDKIMVGSNGSSPYALIEDVGLLGDSFKDVPLEEIVVYLQYDKIYLAVEYTTNSKKEWRAFNGMEEIGIEQLRDQQINQPFEPGEYLTGIRFRLVSAKANASDSRGTYVEDIYLSADQFAISGNIDQWHVPEGIPPDDWHSNRNANFWYNNLFKMNLEFKIVDPSYFEKTEDPTVRMADNKVQVSYTRIPAVGEPYEYYSSYTAEAAVRIPGGAAEAKLLKKVGKDSENVIQGDEASFVITGVENTLEADALMFSLTESPQTGLVLQKFKMPAFSSPGEEKVYYDVVYNQKDDIDKDHYLGFVDYTQLDASLARDVDIVEPANEIGLSIDNIDSVQFRFYRMNEGKKVNSVPVGFKQNAEIYAYFMTKSSFSGNAYNKAEIQFYDIVLNEVKGISTDKVFVSPLSKLVVEKKVEKEGDKVVEPGQKIKYIISVTNPNIRAVEDVTVTDLLDKNFKKIIGRIGPGKTATVEFIYTIPQDAIPGSEIINKVIASQKGEIDPPSDNESVYVKKEGASMKVEKKLASGQKTVVNVGDKVRYVIRVLNIGSTEIKDIEVTDILYKDWIQKIESLAPGGTAEFEFEYTATEADRNKAIANTAYAKAEGLEESGSNESVKVEKTQMTLKKVLAEGQSEEVFPGGTVKYVIYVKNEGDVNLKHITITDTLDPGFVESIDELGVGGEVKYEFEYTVPEDREKGVLTNTAKAASPQIGELYAHVDVYVQSNNPRLSIELKLEDGEQTTVSPGDEVLYVITVDNTGDMDIEKALVKVGLDDSYGELIELISVGGKKVFRFKYKVPEDAVNGQVIVNSATVEGKAVKTGKTVKAGSGAVIIKVKVEEGKKQGSLDITKIRAKTSGDSTVYLAGAKFELLDSKGNVVRGGIITGEDGKVRLNGLEPGTYMLLETAAPTGHNIVGDGKTEVVIEENELTRITVENSLKDDEKKKEEEEKKESEPGRSPRRGGDPEKKPRAETEQETIPGTGTEPGTKPQAGTEPGTKPQAGTEPGTKPQAGTEPGTKPEAGTEPGTIPGTDPGTGTDPETIPGTEAEPGTIPGAGTEPVTEAGSGNITPEQAPESDRELIKTNDYEILLPEGIHAITTDVPNVFLFLDGNNVQLGYFKPVVNENGEFEWMEVDEDGFPIGASQPQTIKEITGMKSKQNPKTGDADARHMVYNAGMILLSIGAMGGLLIALNSMKKAKKARMNK